jgi:acyl-CoA synthetase (AMP-forming)/AMP-acid ligase II
LLGGVDRTRGEVEGRPLRAVFEPGDAWLSTRDLVRVDRDGDYWLVGKLTDVVHTPLGAAPALPIEDILAAELDFVDLAAVYGVELSGLDAAIPVAALTLRHDRKLGPVALRRKVVGRLSGPQRPLVVRVLDELPKTAGHRIRKTALREAGLGLEAGGGETLWLAPGEDAYLPLDPEDLPRLVQAARGG